MGNTAQQDSDFARDLEDSKSTSRGTLCIFFSQPKYKENQEEVRGDPRRDKPASNHTNTQIKIEIPNEDLELSTVDYVHSNVKFSHPGATLYIFEGNEAVIKMIIKGRSPTMRHVSRTRRVAVDWLFDRINLDLEIQIKYVDTKNQLAEILTKSNITTSEISALPAARKRCRREHKKGQEKNEKWPNHSRR